MDIVTHENTPYAPAPPGANGSPVPFRGPRMPGRTERWATLPEPYDDFRFKFWANYPRKLAPDLSGQDEDRQTAAMAQVILEHNGWCNEMGEPLPMLDGTTETFARFWDEVPQEVALVVTTLIGTELGKLSASVMNRRARRS